MSSWKGVSVLLESFGNGDSSDSAQRLFSLCMHGRFLHVSFEGEICLAKGKLFHARRTVSVLRARVSGRSIVRPPLGFAAKML